MRALVQRVSEASVSIDGVTVGAIDTGLLVLLGVGSRDDETQASKLADKVARLRLFDDQQGRMNLSMIDLGDRAAALCVSQFTLYGDTRKGLRPSFTQAAEPAQAERLYDLFCRELEASGVAVQTGRFGARMSVALTNDGPVTLMLEA